MQMKYGVEALIRKFEIMKAYLDIVQRIFDVGIRKQKQNRR